MNMFEQKMKPQKNPGPETFFAVLLAYQTLNRSDTRPLPRPGPSLALELGAPLRRALLRRAALMAAAPAPAAAIADVAATASGPALAPPAPARRRPQ